MTEFSVRAGFVGLLVACLCAGGGVAWAWWSTSATAESPPVASGRLDLTAGPSAEQQFLMGPGGTWTYSALALPSAFPGESVARTLVLRAGGDADLAVSGSAVASSSALGQHLRLHATRDGVAGNTVVNGMRGGTCSGTTLVADRAVTATAAPFFTDLTVGAGGALTLCLVLSLDGTAPSGLQGQSATVSFTLTARQEVAP